MLDIARDRMEIGTVVDVLSGPQDLLVIQPTADWWQARGNEIPPDEGDQKGGPPRFKLPIIKSLVPEINTADRFITADVPPGLEAV
jgi:ribosomal 30S subunit maturation factor RimM